MTNPEQIGLALAVAGCAGLNCYLTALLLAVGFRLAWPGMGGFELLAPSAVMTVAGVLFAIEFVVDKIPRVNLWWGMPHLVVRPACGALFAILSLGSDAGLGLRIGIGFAGAAVAVCVHLGRTVLRRKLNRSPEPFLNVVGSVAVDTIVVWLFFLEMRQPIWAGSIAVLLAAGGALVAWWCRRRKGEMAEIAADEAADVVGE